VKVLVDTSVWIYFFRGREEIVKEIKKLLHQRKIVITGIVVTELLQGVKNEKERKLLEEIFSYLPWIEPQKEDYFHAGIIGKELRSKGITIPVVDLLLGTMAIRRKYHIFTLDRHFKFIPGVKIYKEKQILPE